MTVHDHARNLRKLAEDIRDAIPSRYEPWAAEQATMLNAAADALDGGWGPPVSVTDLARILLRAADLAERDLGGEYTTHEWASYRQLRWLSDAANQIITEDATPVVPSTRTRDTR